MISNLAPSAGAAEEIVGFHSFQNQNQNNGMDYLKIEGLEVTFDSQYVEDSRPYILNGVVGNNVHGDQTVEHRQNGIPKGFYW